MKYIKLTILACILSFSSVAGFYHLKDSSIILIDSIMDLKGKTYVLPHNKILHFKGGKIRNGVVVGDNTVIEGEPIFEDVIILGEWNVPEISTDFFRSSNESQVIVNAFSMTSQFIQNSVCIEKGAYNVSIDQKYLAKVKDSTEVILNGDIILEPNNLERCYIFYIDSCSNVIFNGNGSIVGDRLQHCDTRGEWGMGIYLTHSKDITINGIDISNCWGDCITISGNTSNVRIINCTLHDSRRQGVSICDGANITIDHCLIYNIGGTCPGHGIDIEPDPNNHVNNVVIANTTIYDCWGGVLSHGGSQEATVSNIWIMNSCIYNITKYQPINIYKTSFPYISNNIVKSKDVACILIRETSNGTITNNRIYKSYMNSGVKCDEESILINSHGNKINNSF